MSFGAIFIAFTSVVGIGLASVLAPSAESAAAASCEVTPPNHVVAGKPGAHALDRLSYGNALVSTALGPDGAITFKPGGPGFHTPDGALGMKFLWWRPGHEKLAVTGRRLDAPAPPLRFSSGQATGEDFVPSYVIFPTPGCWEVTAQVGDHADSKLIFVTNVVKIAEGPHWQIDDV